MNLLADQAHFAEQELFGLALAALLGGIFFWSWARVRRSERRILEQAEQINRVFEDSPIGMAIVALNGSWLRVNPALCQILGYEDEEFIGMTWMDFTHPEDVKQDEELVDACLRGEISTYRMAKRYTHKCGHDVYAILVVSLVRGEGRAPLFFQSQVHDVSPMMPIHYEHAPCPQGNETCALRETTHQRSLVVRFPSVLAKS